MVAASYVPDAGHLVRLDLEPSLGKEQAGRRPALVLSPAAYNGKTGLAVMAPITHQKKGYPFEVELPPGCKVTGVVLADHLKNLDWTVRRVERLDVAPPAVLEAVRERIALLLGVAAS